MPQPLSPLRLRVTLKARVCKGFDDPSEQSTQSEAVPGAVVFFAGYSQGGHAAFAARDVAERYAPELSIRGVIGYGATTDVAALLREAPVFAPYVFYTYADLYGTDRVDPAQILLPQWAANLEADVTRLCVDEILGYYANEAEQLYQPDFSDALYDDRLDERFQGVKEALDRNKSGLAPSSIPALILQGTGDPVVTPATQEVFVRQLCEGDAPVTYLTYADVQHVQTRQVSYRDMLEWMETIAAGGSPQTDCPG